MAQQDTQEGLLGLGTRRGGSPLLAVTPMWEPRTLPPEGARGCTPFSPLFS
jgi:hypothetical protein